MNTRNRRRLPLGILALAAVAVELLGGSPAMAQTQTNIGSPFSSLNNGFFENIGVGFNFSVKGSPGALGPNGRGIVGLGANRQLLQNIQFQQNNAAPPLPFGGGAASNPATLGFGIVGSGFTAGFGITAGQGSSSNNTSSTASVTAMNGQQGTITASTQRPFVISVVPVVGGFMPGIVGFDPGSAMQGTISRPPEFSTGLQERLNRIQSGGTSGVRGGASSAAGGGSSGVATNGGANSGGAAHDPISEKLQAARSSSAGQATTSLREIQAQQDSVDAEKVREFNDLMSQAQTAEAAGKFKVARVYYLQAAQRTEGTQLAELKSKIRELGQK